VGRGGAGRGPVLFVSYSGLAGGSEQVLLDVITGLDAPAVLLCAAGPLEERARAAGVAVLARPARPLELRGGPRAAAAAAGRLAAHAGDARVAAGALRPRAVVAWGMRSAIACAGALKLVRPRPPLVFEHVDLVPRSPAAARAVRTAAGSADLVIALSDAVAGDLDPRRQLGDRLRVAWPGIDVERFAASGPPAGPPTALLLGAIVPWKRPDLALEAAAVAARELPGLRLVVAGHAVGEGSAGLLATLRERASRPDLAGRVELTGPLADPRPALAGTSCLLHCSDREPFGLVLLEAMASGRPVVAPASGGPLEIVADGCGRLYPPGDAAAAGRALVELLRDPAETRRAGERAREHVTARFGLDAARRRWREAAAPALGAPRPPSRSGDGLTLVTVSHDSREELERLLRSVARHLPGARVVVADAGSEDGSAEVARRAPVTTAVLELDNVGYGRAVNAAMAAVETPACVVLNPDVELVDDSLAGLAAEALRAGAPERLLAPLVLHPDGKRQDSVHREPVSGASALIAAVPPAVLPPPLARRVQPWRSDRPQAVAWAVGCALGGRAETLRELGPFDRRIFLYGEDMELGLRAGERGVETWWWPGARVIHHESHSARRVYGGRPYDLLAQQRRAVVAERRGERAARWDDRLQLTTFAGRILVKTLLRRPAEQERRQLAALRRARGAGAGLGGSGAGPAT
jgi:GT2 family glycosyltransferase/glycosyltransferase involved in cell wall biosynthesis